MALTEEELAAYGRSFKEFFDRVGRTGIFDLPSDISSDSDGACTPTGLLTPSREDHGMARFTKLELVRERRPPRPTAAEEAEAAENQRLAMVRKVTAEMALHAPDYFTNLDRPGEWIIENHGIRYDWKNRTLRSKKEKEPYLFAMDDEAGLVAITSVGHDFWPEDDKPGSMLPCKNLCLRMLTRHHI
jgi:hypothetical protein